MNLSQSQICWINQSELEVGEVHGGEGSLDRRWLFVVLLDFGQLIKVLSQSDQELEWGEQFGVDVFEVVGQLHNNEVRVGQISQQKIIIPQKLLQVFQLGLELILECSLLRFQAVGHVENLHHIVKAFVEHSDDIHHHGLVLWILSQQFPFAWPVNDVVADGFGFSDSDIIIDKIGQVGEAQSEFGLIASEPLLGGVVLNVLPNGASVGQQESWNLSSASDSPVAQGDFVVVHCKISYAMK